MRMMQFNVRKSRCAGQVSVVPSQQPTRTLRTRNPLSASFIDGALLSEGKTGDIRYDVAIIGGGPAGLVAAKALLAVKPDINIKVYEAASTFQRNLGAGLSIDINGWRALHAVDKALAERVRSHTILLQKNNTYDETGKLLRVTSISQHVESYFREHGHTPAIIHWGDIRQILYDALPEGVVSFDSRLVGLSPGQPGGEPAVLEFQVSEQGQKQKDANGGGDVHGSNGNNGHHPHGAAPSSIQRVYADLVIAADGYFSRSKRLAFDASGPPLLPTFRNRVVWRAVMSYTEYDQMPELLRETGSRSESMWWMSEGQPPRRFALVYPVNDSRFVWTCIAPSEDIEAAGLPPWSPRRTGDQQEMGIGPKERCLAVFRMYPREVLDMLERTDPQDIIEHGYYTHDMAAIRGAPDWVRGNVVAIGDAAHAGPPDGMGLNMAWEDAAVLAAEIKRAGGQVTSETLEAYCDARLPRVREIWSEVGMVMPRRQAAKLAAAFEPLGPGSSGWELTAPKQQSRPA